MHIVWTFKSTVRDSNPAIQKPSNVKDLHFKQSLQTFSQLVFSMWRSTSAFVAILTFLSFLSRSSADG